MSEPTAFEIRRCEDGRICRYPRDLRPEPDLRLIIGVALMVGALCFGLGAVIGWNVHR